jgi:RES domain-containing protein
MILYRIVRNKYANDLSGRGGLLSAARWHDHLPVIYTSVNSSTCILEKLVHMNPDEIHNDLEIITLNIPDSLESEVLLAEQLPKNWNKYPAPEVLKRIGNYPFFFNLAPYTQLAPNTARLHI